MFLKLLRLNRLFCETFRLKTVCVGFNSVNLSLINCWTLYQMQFHSNLGNFTKDRQKKSKNHLCFLFFSLSRYKSWVLPLSITGTLWIFTTVLTTMHQDWEATLVNFFPSFFYGVTQVELYSAGNSSILNALEVTYSKKIWEFKITIMYKVHAREPTVTLFSLKGVQSILCEIYWICIYLVDNNTAFSSTVHQ